MPAVRPSYSKKKEELLSIKEVDLFKDETSKKHFTSAYESNDLVLRRGIPFKLLITLSRDVVPDENFVFELRMGGRPMVHHGSLIRLPALNPVTDKENVGYKSYYTTGNTILAEFYTSGQSTSVGEWSLCMRSVLGKKRSKRLTVTDIIMLFNPWCKFDPVYMANEKWRDEYVLNEEGMQFVGNRHRISGIDWHFGQFEPVVLKTCLKLLRMENLRYSDQCNPAMVARHFSALVNSQDDDGVLEGNWSGDYEDGISPGSWNGSVEILEQYMESGEPVKYGQCWVFSGVFTTVMRCLGIPARSLTNFDSAHDTDGNLTIDYHFDMEGEPMDNDDSVWNFHVWNDVWMARPYLPEGHGGWQAIDATPQETSWGKFRCGPMSLEAIKNGKLGYDYDGAFIYAEVNASKRYWQKKMDESDEWSLVRSHDSRIGNNISTKAVGRFEREDITSQYKFAEHTPEERLSFQNARKFVRRTHEESKTEKLQQIQVVPNISSVLHFGNNLNFSVQVNNTSDKQQNVFLRVVTKVMQYNGSLVAKVSSDRFSGSIDAGSSETYHVRVSSSDYLKLLTKSGDLKVSFLGGCEDKEQESFVSQVVVDVERPTISIEVDSKLEANKSHKVKLSFTNPLKQAIQGYFKITGAGLSAASSKVVKIGANKTCNIECTATVKKLGEHRLMASFISSSVSGIRGASNIIVY